MAKKKSGGKVIRVRKTKSGDWYLIMVDGEYVANARSLQSAAEIGFNNCHSGARGQNRVEIWHADSYTLLCDNDEFFGD